MKVYALVGKSGTGKSYQAMNLCREKNISAIIDDGLLISGSSIIAGISAKRQETKIGAIKTALFSNEEHRRVVVGAIKSTAPSSILLIGTSDKMVSQIAQKLELPDIEETIYIEDITSEEERELAHKQRNELGKHVIPVPTFQLKKDFSGYFLDALRIFRGRGAGKETFAEKSVVRPTYSYLGEYSISGKVIEDIINYTAKDIDEVVSVGKVTAKTSPGGIQIWIAAVFKYGVSIPITGRRLQQKIASRIALMTAFNIEAVNIEVRAER